jgi:serine/threonine protein kinase
MIDFGMSKLTGKGNKKINLSTYCGTIDFIAPEIFEGQGYDKMCDIWSLGVIAYFMLSGQPPFIGKDDIAIKTKIVSCNYSFDDPVWANVSQEAKDWIDGLLELAPGDRLDVDAALEHTWLSSIESIRYTIHSNVMVNLRACNKP